MTDAAVKEIGHVHRHITGLAGVFPSLGVSSYSFSVSVTFCHAAASKGYILSSQSYSAPGAATSSPGWPAKDTQSNTRLHYSIITLLKGAFKQLVDVSTFLVHDLSDAVPPTAAE